MNFLVLESLECHMFADFEYMRTVMFEDLL